MVTRKRVNLSLAEADYERLAVLAASEGKTVSGFALDQLKAAIYAGRFPMAPKPVKTIQEPPKFDTVTRTLPGIEKTPVAPLVASRKDRRHPPKPHKGRR